LDSRQSLFSLYIVHGFGHLESVLFLFTSLWNLGQLYPRNWEKFCATNRSRLKWAKNLGEGSYLVSTTEIKAWSMLYSDEQKGIYAVYYSKSTANISWRIDLLSPMNGVGQTQIFPFWWPNRRRFWVGETLAGVGQTFWIIKSLLAWRKMDFFIYCKEFIGLMQDWTFLYIVKGLLAWCMSNPDPSTWIAFLICKHLHGFLSRFQWVSLWCNCAYWLFFPQIFNDFTNVMRNSWKNIVKKESFQDFFKKDFTICHKDIIGGA